MCLRMYLWRSAFCSHSSLRKVSRKPKILNRMWCYCCFYLHYKINISPHSEVYVLYKLQAWRKNGKCLLRASVKRRSERLTGRKGRWKRTRKLTVLGAYKTTQPFQTKLVYIRNKITNTNKYCRNLCYLSGVFVCVKKILKQEWLLPF